MNSPSTSAAETLVSGAFDVAGRSVGAPTGEFLQQVVNSVQSPVFVKDEQYRFVFFNEAFCKLLGRMREELIGRTDYDVVPPEQAVFFQEIDGKVLASNAPHESEEMLTNLDGVEYWLFTRKSVFEVRSGERYVVGVISDITERKRIERDLVAAKVQAEDANRAKSQFLANMSHELRTPLNAVIGFSEIIKQELLGAIGEQRYREYAEDIHRSGVHLLQLINDILDLTKVEAAKYELREDVCDLGKVVEVAVGLMGNLAIQNELSIRSFAPPDLPLLFADERCVRQIIMNFLSNAVKFTAKGGHIEVDARLHPDGSLAVSVTDTGIGMAEGDIPTALGAFRQLENALSRKYEGTGLGLPLVKALLDLHQGSLHLESKVGSGTTASARFPANRTVYR